MTADSANAAIRKVFRRHPPWSEVRAEFERQYGRAPAVGEVERIVSTAFIEARQLAGWTRDRMLQAWRRADGSVVQHDDGREWAHL